MPEPSLNEISVTVGSLRAQIGNLEAAVSRMVESQAKIVDSLTENRESAAGFKEYRGTLHERFNNIHVQMAKTDELLDKHDARFERIERDLTACFDRLEKDMMVRFDTMAIKTENMFQSMGLKYEHRVAALEKQQVDWKATLRTSYTFVFVIATMLGSAVGYLAEVFVRSAK